MDVRITVPWYRRTAVSGKRGMDWTTRKKSELNGIQDD
jgi:hypothetical protein